MKDKFTTCTLALFLLISATFLNAQSFPTPPICAETMNQLADPQLTDAIPNPAITFLNSPVQFRFANAGLEVIPVNTVQILMTIDDTKYNFGNPIVASGGVWVVDPSESASDAITLKNIGGPIEDGDFYDIVINLVSINATSQTSNYSVVLSRMSQTCVGDVLNNSISNSKSAAIGNGVLPIKLISFNAKKVNNEEVMLNWETATEENFKGFDVESSIDGTKFNKIGYVDGRGSDSKYLMVDRNPFQGVNYYRLKSVDVDGSFVYSDIRAVEITERSRRELAVFPNPFNGGFTLSGLKPGSDIKIYDIKGSVVYANKTDDSVFRVNASTLVGGVYNVSVTNSGETISKRLIKIE